MSDRRPLPRPTACCHRVVAALLAVTLAGGAAHAQEKFKETRSRSQYAHHIQLYDARGIQIDPTAEDARPYSPNQTCKKCHDYKAIEHGYHFNAADLAVFGELTAEGEPKPLDHGRRGEPWLWTDEATGTQIPLSYRPWPGVYDPGDVGLSPFRFTKEFGRHKPGGGVGEREPYTGEEKTEAASSNGNAASTSSNGGDDANANASDTSETSPAPNVDPDSTKWKSRGHLEIDCMICHSANRAYSHEKYIKEIEKENFAWAPTVALGIGKSDGYASSLPDDYDPQNLPDGEAAKLPTTKYDKTRFDSEGTIFMDIVRTPPNNACYMCHTARPVGEQVQAKWQHDEDVHLRAGMQCADCHRNGIDHHTVRGYEGETHPTGVKIETLSCRGCHYDEDDPADPTQTGGRLGAPKPEHKGIPPVHFDTMSCTSCHSGALPSNSPQRVQTSMAHALGKAAQDKTDTDLPGIVQPVFLKNDDDVLYPHRMVWPAFWGWMEGNTITPIGPDDAWLTLRRPPLRIRRGTPLREQLAEGKLSKADRVAALGSEEEAAKPDEELTDEQRQTLDAKLKETQATQFKEGLGKGLAMFAAKPPSEGAVPVYVAGGKVYRIKEGAEIPSISALRTESPPVVSFEHEAAKPYAWAIGHDVRPARKSLGVTGCTECHVKDAPMFYGEITAVSPAIDSEPVSTANFEMMKLDADKLSYWEQSFGGRPLFKWVGFVAVGAVALIVVLALLLALNGVLKLVSGRR